MKKGVAISGKWQVLEGYAFGFHQPVLIGAMQIPDGLRLNTVALKATFERIVGVLPDLSPPESIPRALVEWLLGLSHHLEKACKIAVFSPGKVVMLRPNAGEGRLELRIALPYHTPSSTVAAITWVVEVADGLVRAQTSEAIKDVVLTAKKSWATLRNDLQKFGAQGINTDRILRAAMARGTPFRLLEEETYVLGHGKKSRWLNSTFTDRTSNISSRFARQKYSASHVLAFHGLPVPKHFIAADADAAVQYAEKLGYPVVIKPADRDGGVGVHAGLTSEALVRSCYEHARTFSKKILVEKHFEGADFRLTVLDGKMIKANERIPGGVTGDGQNDIRELLARATDTPEAQRRRRERGKVLLTLDEEALSLLHDLGMTPDSVPEAGRFVRLRRRANVSTGGSTRLVTDQVHPDNRRLAERAAEVMRLDVAGIDLLIPDITKSWLESGAVICEVNAQPQIGEGEAFGLYETFLNTLLEGDGQIPIALVVTPEDHDKVNVINKYLDAFSGNRRGTMTGAAGILRCDDECLNPQDMGFVKTGLAAVHYLKADRALLTASVKEILGQGLPCKKLDQLIFDTEKFSSGFDKGLLQRLKQFLMPHVSGVMIYSTEDRGAVLLAESLAISQRCVVSVTQDSPLLKQHLSDGGMAVWRKGEKMLWGTSNSCEEIDQLVVDSCKSREVLTDLFAIAIAKTSGREKDKLK